MLPAGNLREGRAGAKRADVIVVTKCPPGLKMTKRQEIVKKLNPEPNQQVFFTYIAYDEKVHSQSATIAVQDLKKMPKVLVAGIAKPKPFFDHLATANDILKTYPDHHQFSEKEISELQRLSEDKIIITTEKDYVRLKGKLDDEKLFYLPIKSNFIKGSEDFDKTILSYVEQSTGNRYVYSE